MSVAALFDRRLQMALMGDWGETAQNDSPRLEVSWNAGATSSPSAFHLIRFRAGNWHKRTANRNLSASEHSIREEMFWERVQA